MTRRLAALCIFVLSLVWGSASPTRAQDVPPPPTSMASIGDSITRAADVCCWYGDHPSNSWSTGGAGWDRVTSLYERIRALNPAIAGRNHNDAVSGAKMANGPAQAQRAVTQQAQFVTILLGANDLCTSSPRSMTRVRISERSCVRRCKSSSRACPRMRVSSWPASQTFTGCGPSITRTGSARLVWDAADICQSLLAPTRTEEQRQLVRTRNIAFNAVLAKECAAYPRCRFDRNAVFNFQFSRSHVSKLDYFHPNLAGQAELARVTWAHTWWN